MISETVALALIATIVPTVTVILTYLSSRRKLRKVHDLVDGSHSEALEKIEALQEALTAIIEESREPPPANADVGQRRRTDPLP